MTTVNIEIHDQAVRQALGALAQRLGNLEPALLTIGEAMAERVKQRFNSQSGPGGQKWQALKPATVRAKKGNTAILFDKGHLRRQIVATATGNTLTLASVGLAYAAIQQFGGTIERAAGQTTVSHRTDAKGKLLRSAIMGGKGLIFAKGKHSENRKLTRTFDVAAHQIKIPARPFMPVRSDGTLYADEQRQILEALQAWLDGAAGA